MNSLPCGMFMSVWTKSNEIIYRCPECGHKLLSLHSGSGQCEDCGLKCEVAGNIISFERTGSHRRPLMTKSKLSLNVLGRAARYYFDPLASPWSPVTWITRRRLDAYYIRCLSDRALAESFAGHYLKNCKLPKRARVLDHGCGQGRVVAMLSQLGYVVVGQEVTKHSWWQNLPHSRFVVCPNDSNNFPYAEEMFHLTIDFEVIGHIEVHSLPDLIGEVHRVLIPDGYWVLLEANSKGWAAHLPRKHYGRLHDLEFVVSLAEQQGFECVTMDYEGFYSPLFPRLINVFRKNLNPFSPLVIEDYDSAIAKLIQPEKRGLWHLVLKKPGQSV